MRKQQGISIVEIIVVVAIVGILSGIVISATNVRGLNNELVNATRELAGHFKQVRAKAMVTTSAYRLVAENSPVINKLEASWASNCDATTWTADPKFDVELRGDVSITGFVADDVIICFTSRGIANSNPTVTLTRDGKTQQVEVFLGGGVDIK